MNRPTGQTNGPEQDLHMCKTLILGSDMTEEIVDYFHTVWGSYLSL